MNICLASGKGGTGKTTIAVNLAASLDRPVHFLDCDVEEPNAHLFLDLAWRGEESVSVAVPEIDPARCNACRKCLEICRFRALTLIKGKMLTFPELCHGCGGCQLVCPEGAVSDGKRLLGRLRFGDWRHITFTGGESRVGEAMSPPLIRAVKGQAKESELTIIDAPPGTSCPMITALRGVDFAVMVTEPTPFGLHDLRLAVAAARRLALPIGLVVNRAGIGDERLADFARAENIPILLEIPFDREIAAICSRGQLLVEALPVWRREFQRLFWRIERLCQGLDAA
ncbi:MAG: ATP-binding protein [Desulfobulbaceae bacterium]|jgi:MinD superfamily P-loop ATPase|nr:ATP-binding protein [Desulfobulbaceae bacterium]